MTGVVVVRNLPMGGQQKVHGDEVRLEGEWVKVIKSDGSSSCVKARSVDHIVTEDDFSGLSGFGGFQ